MRQCVHLIASGELHLTALLMLGPHLTEENHLAVLERAKHRTKKEIARLVRMLDPLPSVAPLVEPLGPARSGLAVRTNPTWSEVTAALAGPVRELEPGERPKDWIDPDADLLGSDASDASAAPLQEDPDPDRPAKPSSAIDPQADPPLGPQRYKVQFTATQEYVDLLEEARDLLAHAVPTRSLEEVHLRAMRSLVDELKKRKYAFTDKPRARRPKGGGVKGQSVDEHNPRQRQRGSDVDAAKAEQGLPSRVRFAEPKRRSRYIPARVRRAVWQRDQGRCTFVDARGEQCRETSYLQLHHQDPHARGGPPSESNLCLRCHAHNALAAEEDFGRELMIRKRKGYG